MLERQRGWASDIQEHIPRLMALAADSDVVVEFGVRDGTSTLALLSGTRGTVESWDIEMCAGVAPISDVAGDKWKFHLGDSLEAVIPECDLLFIDSKHTGAQLGGELTRHAHKARKYIALHDTESYGHIGEDGAGGLRSALINFLLLHTEWHIDAHYPGCNGFTVLKRTAP